MLALKTTDFTDVFHIWSVSSNMPGFLNCILSANYEFLYSLVMAINFLTIGKQFLGICCKAVVVKLAITCFVIKLPKTPHDL